MLPFLIDRPGFRLGSGHTLTYLAVGVCVVVSSVWATRREGLDPWRVRMSLVGLALAALAGGRLHFVLNHPDLYADGVARALTPTGGGFHLGGGIVIMGLAAVPITRGLGLRLGKLADALVFPMGLAIAITRIGCFLHGCCFGPVCQWPWCVAFPPESGVFGFQREAHLIPPDATASLPVHPLQLYFVAAALGVAWIGFAGLRRKRYDGQVAWLGLLAFSASTALLETLRVPDGTSPMWGALPQLLWTAIALSIGSSFGLAVAELTHDAHAARPVPDGTA